MSGPTPPIAQRPTRAASLGACCVRRSIAKKPKGKPMPRRTARANARKSAVRASVEHAFAHQKGPMGLFIRTIGIVRARTKIGLANLTYNMQRMVWLMNQATAVCPVQPTVEPALGGNADRDNQPITRNPNTLCPLGPKTQLLEFYQLLEARMECGSTGALMGRIGTKVIILLASNLDALGG